MFKLPQNRSFIFEPRYYDAIKEEVEQRERFIKAEMDYEKRLAIRLAKLREEGEEDEAKLLLAKRMEISHARISDAFQSRKRDESKPLIMQAFIAIMLTAVLVMVYYYMESTIPK